MLFNSQRTLLHQLNGKCVTELFQWHLQPSSTVLLLKWQKVGSNVSLPRVVCELGFTYWSLLHSTMHFKIDTKHSKPFSLGSVPTKEFIKAIKTTTNLLKKTNSSSLGKAQFENVFQVLTWTLLIPSSWLPLSLGNFWQIIY